MRTTDFSQAPVQGRAAAMIVTERRFDSARDALRARSAHRALAVHLAGSPGFLWQKRFRRAPHVRGIVSYFTERAQLDSALASLPPALSAWVNLAGPAPTGRILEAEPSGYTNGQWRAEDGAMAHIERFTPTSVEAARGTEPPLVAAKLPSTRRKRPGRSRTDRPWRPIADTHSMFLGATKYTGPAAIIYQARIYFPMIAQMVKMRGYVWFTTYYVFPFTLGTLAFFSDRDDLIAFARMPGHRHLMQWITKDTRSGSAGFIRLHTDPEEVFER
jgi:hypothetical protein